MDDQPPLPIINNLIVGSRLTPVKHRSITPNTLSNNARSNSVNKKLQLAQSYAEIQEPIKTVPQKYISRRKFRQWENANMVLLHKFLNTHGLNQSFKKMELNDTKTNVSRLNNNIDREAFLTFIQPKPKVIPSSRRTVNNEKLPLVESIWISKVKKELRTIILNLFLKCDNLFEYMIPLEQCLLHFISHSTAIEMEILPMSFSSVLIKGASLAVEDNVMILPLRDLPLHRLITFASCQFYGIHCDVSTVALFTCLFT